MNVAMQAAFDSWQFWILVAGGLVAYGELRWNVGRHKKILNGPLDVLKNTVAAIDKKLDVMAERQANRDKEIENLRGEVRDERRERMDGFRRIYEKIDTGKYKAD